MAQTGLVNAEEIKKAITKLPKEEIIKLDGELHKYMETFLMMEVAEKAFSDWLNPEEDIYNDDV